MEDRLTNLLIVLILVIVIGLGFVYAYKIAGDDIDILNILNNELQDDDTDMVDASLEANTNENILVEEEVVERNSITATIEEESQTSITITNYNNKYYYNQLDTYSKVIYDAVAKNTDNLKSGNYTIYIDYDFSDLLNETDGEERLNDYYSDAINAINLDISSLFYIDFSKVYLNIESTTTIFSTTYKLYLDAGDNGTYFSSGFSSQAEVENAISNIESVSNEICNLATGIDYSKIKTVHDWLIDNLSYKSDTANANNMYGALVQKNAVCEGYARAYKYLLDKLNITNVLIVGTATNSNGDTEDHMWNYVYLNRFMVCSRCNLGRPNSNRWWNCIL